MTEGAAGMDICADIDHDRTLAPLERALIPAGLAIALPPGFEAQIRPRSGLALRQGLTMINSPGTIDSDYRGEIQLIAINLGSEPFAIARGTRFRLPGTLQGRKMISHKLFDPYREIPLN